jgi:nucleotide-binding universal stress UspA family protein
VSGRAERAGDEPGNTATVSPGRRIASFAAERHARMIVIGTPADSGSAGLFDASLTAQLIRHARCEVHLVPIMAHRELAAADTGRR